MELLGGMSGKSARLARRRLSKIAANRRNRTRRLGHFEPLEDRRVLTALISELHVDPLFGSNSTDQYVELRGPESGTLNAGTYLVVVDGDQSERGNVHTIFDLSGLSFGSNGYLVLLEHGNGYTTNPAANVLTSTADAFAGLPGNIFSDEFSLSNSIDFIFRSNNFFLIESATPPLLTDDIDSNDDGTPDGVFTSWTVLDSVAILYGFGEEASYAAITFRDGGGLVQPGSTVVQMEHSVSYVGRIGESTGSAATDWVGGTTQERSGNNSEFRLTRGTFGTPEPKVFSGRDLDHIGEPNFFSTISGTVFDDADGNGTQGPGEPGRAGVVVTTDNDNNPATGEYVVRIEPDHFPLQSDMTNVIPNATLTTAHSDDEILSFVARPQTSSSAITGEYVFAHEGVAFTSNTRKIRIEFYEPVRSVSIDVTGRSVIGRLEAFDRSDQSQGFVRTTQLVDDEVQRLTITHATPDIAYVLAYSDSDFMDSSPFGVFDNASFIQHEYTTTTDSNGDYEFNLLPPGAYTVSVANDGTLIPTTPTSRTVALGDTESARDVNFGSKSNSAPNIANQAFSVDEDAVGGTEVGTVVASDDDAGQQLGYSIIGGTGAGHFAIHPTTGVITVKDSADLDFESNPSLTLTVQAQDNYGTPASSAAEITISVDDANEAPVIAAATFFMNENAAVGFSVGGVTATDVDGDAVSYSISGGNTNGAFAIDPDSGEITVANSAPLDAEARTHINLSVQATDDGSPVRSSTRIVRINIASVNEDPSIPSQSFEIDENSDNGAAVGTLVVNDPDVGESFQFSVTGGSGQNAFAIHPTSGEITVKQPSLVDFEMASSFTLEFDVADSGSPPLTAAGTVEIAIRDQNDPPTAAAQTFSVAENSDQGTAVGTVSANDADAGQNLSFAINGGTGQGLFHIQALSGAITVADAGGLDFEQTASFTLEVEVTDSGIPAAATTALVTVELEDANDPPAIETQQFALPENVPTGTVVGLVTASDVDAGDSLAFEIVGDGGTPIFAIDENSGVLSTVQVSPLDLEENASFTIEVQVTDLAGETDQAAVTIELQDVNEFDPFIEDQAFSLAEDLTPDAPVGTVIASDADQGQILSYEITDGNTGNTFSIQPDTGQIRVQTAVSLDHESVPSYALTVKVTDNVSPVRSSSATVTIDVEDVNEFAPVIGDASFIVDENAAAGTQIGTVTATDADTSQHVTYSITDGNTDDVFEIDSASGAIRVASPTGLDHETNPTFELSIAATDSGQPSQASTSTVTINVDDLNEFAPTLEPHVFDVDEHTATGSVVGVVTGTDLDSSQRLTYTLLSGNTQNVFQFDSSNGEIRVASSFALDHELVTEFTLVILVSDNGSPPQTGTGSVTINVNDVNETAPNLAFASLSVAEGSPVGASLGAVSASDLDTRQTLAYSIIDGNIDEAFAIDEATGDVTLKTPEAVNFEERRTYDLTIQVTDSGTPPRSDSLTYVVLLTDVNEFDPVVADQSLDVAEDVSAGTTVATVEAADDDTFQSLRFDITDGNAAGAFQIDAISGAISVADPSILDFETTPAYTLTIEAIDDGSPARTGVGTISVSVSDVNESAPTVSETALHIAENSEPGASAGAVSVTDADTAQSHTFEILAGEGGDVFEIDSTEGTITLADGQSLDHEATASLTLSVRVTDSGTPPLSTTASVNVVIDDVNETPTANIVGPFTIHAGESLNLDATGSTDVDADDVLTFAWDLDDDGAPDVTSGDLITTVPWSTLVTLGLEVGTHPIALTLTDLAGAAASESSTLTISDSLAFVSPDDGTPTDIQLGFVDGMLAVGDSAGTSNSVPPTAINEVTIQGSTQSDTLTIDYTSGNPIPAGGLSFDGGDGVDAFVIGGSDVHLDLTGTPPTRFTNIEMINIIGNSPNTLTVDAASVVAITDSSNTLAVISDGDDTVNLDDAWDLTGTMVESGRFIRVLEQGDATIHLTGPNDWSHPVDPFDVNNSGGVEPIDVLLIVNELNRPRYTSGNGKLNDAVALSQFPGFFFDVTNDFFTTPLDALVIINKVNGVQEGEGESPGSELVTPAPVFAAPVFAAPVFAAPGSTNAVARASRWIQPTPHLTDNSSDDAGRVDAAGASASAHPAEVGSQTTRKLLAHAVDDLFAELDALDVEELFRN